jgi:site-specific DNA recombinase
MVCNMFTTMYPQCAILLARISDARNGDSHGVTGQLADLRAYATRLEWGVGHEVVENDTSAYLRRTVRLPDGSKGLRTHRPEFRRALRLLASGEADGLLAVDLDRTCRDPRDLEDLIDVVEAAKPRLPVESITGSLRLATDADVATARIMVTIANKASRDTACRVANERRRKAAGGIDFGGGRCYGYEPGMLTVNPAEAAWIVKAAHQVLAGASLRSCVAEMNTAGAVTVNGRPWSTNSLRCLLLRPRLAGIAVHHGAEVGPGRWPPILDEATWRAAAAILRDPARRTAASNEPRHLLSTIAWCGVCDDGTTVHASGPAAATRYRCRSGAQHLGRAAAACDQFVGAVIAARLARPDAADLMTPTVGTADTAALNRDAAVLRERLNEQAALHARGAITTAQLEAGSAILRGELRDVERDLARSAGDSPLAGVAGRRDAAEVWAQLPLWRQRAIIRALVVPVLLPAKPGRQPGGGYFDPASIAFRWQS